MDLENLQEQFDQSLSRSLAERQRLSNASVQKLYSRRALEQGFLECFELVGGIPRLALWANDPENYGEFLKLLMKFAPKEVEKQAGQVIQYMSSIPESPLNHALPQDGVISDDSDQDN